MEAIDEHFAPRRRARPRAGHRLWPGRRRRIVYAGGVGVLRVGDAEPPGPDTASRLCSMTKSFVAAAVLLLRDQGRLALDDPVSQPRSRAGLAQAAHGRLAADHDPQPADHVRAVCLVTTTGATARWTCPPGESTLCLRAGATFAHPPGTTFEYSNFGWVMLGRVVTNRRRHGRAGVRHAEHAAAAGPGVDLVEAALAGSRDDRSPLARRRLERGIGAPRRRRLRAHGRPLEHRRRRGSLDDLPARRVSAQGRPGRRSLCRGRRGGRCSRSTGRGPRPTTPPPAV